MRWMRAAMMLGCAAAGAGRAAAENSQCAAAPRQQFAFWVGDWDVFEAGANGVPGKDVVAQVRVDAILDGCVLREEYNGADGHRGQSFSVYDATRGVWHQTWVTNRGELLVIEGKWRDGAMALSGRDRSADGKERLERATWKPVKGGVRETALRSTDGGKTWQQWFDLLFRPHAK